MASGIRNKDKAAVWFLLPILIGLTFGCSLFFGPKAIVVEESADILNRPCQKHSTDFESEDVRKGYIGVNVIWDSQSTGWTLSEESSTGYLESPIHDFGEKEEGGVFFEWEKESIPELVTVSIDRPWYQWSNDKRYYAFAVPDDHIAGIEAIYRNGIEVHHVESREALDTESPAAFLRDNAQIWLFSPARTPQPGEYSYSFWSDEQKRDELTLSVRFSEDKKEWTEWLQVGSHNDWQEVPAPYGRYMSYRMDFRKLGERKPVLKEVEFVRGPDRPNIVLLLADTLRADHVGAYRQMNVDTPNMDELAKKGVLFEQAITHQPLSAPAYATLFTSLYTYEHGLNANTRHFSKAVTALPEMLKENGYETAAVVANAFCGRDFGFDQGFDFLREKKDMPKGTYAEYVNNNAFDWMLERRASGRTQPYFLFVAYMDPHSPYVTQDTPPRLSVSVGSQRIVTDPEVTHIVHTSYFGSRMLTFDLKPGVNEMNFSFQQYDENYCPRIDEPYKVTRIDIQPSTVQARWQSQAWDAKSPSVPYSLKAEDTLILNNTSGKPAQTKILLLAQRDWKPQEAAKRYLAVVEHLDDQIGEFLTKLEEFELAKDTVVVLLSDHGEELGEHKGSIGHGGNIYDTSVRVPLIISAASLPAGTRIRKQVGLVDVMPTILAMSSTDHDRTIRGVNLLDSMRGEAQTHEYGFMESYSGDGSLSFGGIRTVKRKVIQNISSKQLEYYDLIKDPTELADLSDSKAKEADQLFGVFGKIKTGKDRSRSVDLGSKTQEELDQLRGMGYLE